MNERNKALVNDTGGHMSKSPVPNAPSKHPHMPSGKGRGNNPARRGPPAKGGGKR
jgi:hypothetical protein